MTVEQLSKGNEIKKQIQEINKEVEERVKMYNVLDSKHENKDERVWLSVWGEGAYFKIEIIKDFLQSDMKRLMTTCEDLEAEFLNL